MAKSKSRKQKGQPIHNHITVNVMISPEGAVSYDVRNAPRHAQYGQPIDMRGDVFAKIRQSVGSLRAEQGGMLGMNRNGVITHYQFDTTGSRTHATYSPDTQALNQVIRRWREDGIRFCGFVHSHPGGSTQLSHGDLVYAERILRAMPQTVGDTLVMPVIQPARGLVPFSIHPYTVRLDKYGVSARAAELYIDGKRYLSPRIRDEVVGALRKLPALLDSELLVMANLHTDDPGHGAPGHNPQKGGNG